MVRRQIAYQPGSRVRWANAEGASDGVIRKVFTHRLERTLNGATVTRPANRRNPAYLIEKDCGLQLLLNHSDLVPV